MLKFFWVCKTSEQFKYSREQYQNLKLAIVLLKCDSDCPKRLQKKQKMRWDASLNAFV